MIIKKKILQIQINQVNKNFYLMEKMKNKNQKIMDMKSLFVINLNMNMKNMIKNQKMITNKKKLKLNIMNLHLFQKKRTHLK